MSEPSVSAHPDIRRIARGSLIAAAALDVTPTPLHVVIAAVGLQQENIFELGTDVPPSMVAIIKKLSGRVLGGIAIKERTVYVDPNQRTPRRRFTTAHELGHEAIPWHEAAYFADDQHTLAPDTRLALEREANIYAAELLFQLDRFTEQADSYAPSIGVAMDLATTYEVSAHAALRRYAETSRHAIALVTLGDFTVRSGTALKIFPEQCASSSSFTVRYGHITSLSGGSIDVSSSEATTALASLSRGVYEEPIDFTVETRRGPSKFQAHLFYNGRLRFMLLTRKQLLGRRLRAVNINGPRPTTNS